MGERDGERIGHLQKQAIAMLFALQFLSGAIMLPQRSLFPVYAEQDLGYTALLISLLAALRQVLGMGASLVGGALADALGRRRTFLLGLGGLVTGGLVFLTRRFPLVILLWASIGFTTGLHTVGGQGYLIETARPEALGVLSAFYTWGMTLGGAAGNLVAGPVVDRSGFGSLGGMMVAVSIVTLLGAALWLPRPWRQDAASGRHAGDRLLGYGSLLGRSEVILLGVLRFLPTCYWGLASVFLPLWLYNLTRSAAMVAWFGAVSQVVASLAQWLIGYLADRFGRRLPTLAMFVILVVAAVAIGVWGESVWGLYLFGTIAASAAWSLSALMPGLVADIAAPTERGRVLGWLHLLWNGGMLAGSLIGGALFSRSAGLSFQVVGVLNISSIILAMWFFRIVARRHSV